MKKFFPIVLILALAVLVICFAACGNDNVDNTLTSLSNEMTSIMDDATTLSDNLDEDLTDMSDMLTDEFSSTTEQLNSFAIFSTDSYCVTTTTEEKSSAGIADKAW